MPGVIRISLVGFLVFLLAELALRWWARASIEVGATVPVFGDFYLANVKNANSTMALGLSSQAWLLVALVISLTLVFAFIFLLHVPQLSQGRFAAIGTFSAFLLLAVIVANLFEVSVLGGVTDYLAIVDTYAGRAKVVNLGDLMLFASMAAIIVSAIGAGVCLTMALAKTAA